MITSRTIFVTFQVEGIHCYPDAPKGVEFLKHPHRHLFQYKVFIDVNTNEREIEFILFKRELQALYGSGVLKADSKSCETLAEELITYIVSKYPNRYVTVEVNEDSENGAILSHDPALI